MYSTSKNKQRSIKIYNTKKSDNMKKFKSTGIRVSLSLVAIMATVFSCQKNYSSPATTSTTGISIHLTDDPSIIFDAVFIDIAKVEIRAEDDSTGPENEHHNGTGDSSQAGGNTGAGNNGGAWTALDIRPGVYNLLNFKNGADTLLGTASFPSVQTLKKIRITLGANNSVVLNGASFPLTLKDNVITINLDEASVNVTGNGEMNMWLDFDAGRSIKSNGNKFELQSSIKAFSKEKAGSLEGRVTPMTANPVIYAINGADTSTAIPEKEGEFKFIGLKPGTYTLFVDATANNYLDATVTGIVVGKEEDTHVNTITLHQ